VVGAANIDRHPGHLAAGRLLAIDFGMVAKRTTRAPADRLRETFLAS
jgi:hypothetical protein